MFRWFARKAAAHLLTDPRLAETIRKVVNDGKARGTIR